MDLPAAAVTGGALPWRRGEGRGEGQGGPGTPSYRPRPRLLPLTMRWAVGLMTVVLAGYVQVVGGLRNETSNTTSVISSSELLDFLLSGMDPRVRPNAYGPPVHVTCGIYVVSFGSISELNMDYTMDIYMRQFWEDPRLEYGTHMPPVILPPKSMDQVWTPDIFFPNEKSASFHMVTVPNKLMRIYPNGTVVYSVRITLTMACHMVLTNFPMDYQECYIKMESYGHETRDMTLAWSAENAIEVGDDLELPQFDLEGVETVNCVHQYKTGDFPCLKARFRLRRQFGFYLLQTYIPSILIVILSWVSFWINMDAVPARISLGVTTVLTMATQLTGSRQSIPKVSYPKAIDVWMSMCMVFVFSALLEYAFVNVMARKKPTATYKKTDHPEDVEDAGATPKKRSGNKVAGSKHPQVDGSNGARLEQLTCETDEESTRSTPVCPSRLRALLPRVANSRRCATLVDVGSRYFFPGAFLLFNIVYWSIYTQPRAM